MGTFHNAHSFTSGLLRNLLGLSRNLVFAGLYWLQSPIVLRGVTIGVTRRANIFVRADWHSPLVRWRFKCSHSCVAEACSTLSKMPKAIRNPEIKFTKVGHRFAFGAMHKF